MGKDALNHRVLFLLTIAIVVASFFASAYQDPTGAFFRSSGRSYRGFYGSSPSSSYYAPPTTAAKAMPQQPAAPLTQQPSVPQICQRYNAKYSTPNYEILEPGYVMMGPQNSLIKSRYDSCHPQDPNKLLEVQCQKLSGSNAYAAVNVERICANGCDPKGACRAKPQQPASQMQSSSKGWTAVAWSNAQPQTLTTSVYGIFCKQIQGTVPAVLGGPLELEYTYIRGEASAENTLKTLKKETVESTCPTSSAFISYRACAKSDAKIEFKGVEPQNAFDQVKQQLFTAVVSPPKTEPCPQGTSCIPTQGCVTSSS